MSSTVIARALQLAPFPAPLFTLADEVFQQYHNVHSLFSQDPSVPEQVYDPAPAPTFTITSASATLPTSLLTTASTSQSPSSTPAILTCLLVILSFIIMLVALLCVTRVQKLKEQLVAKDRALAAQADRVSNLKGKNAALRKQRNQEHTEWNSSCDAYQETLLLERAEAEKLQKKMAQWKAHAKALQVKVEHSGAVTQKLEAELKDSVETGKAGEALVAQVTRHKYKAMRRSERLQDEMEILHEKVRQLETRNAELEAAAGLEELENASPRSSQKEEFTLAEIEDEQVEDAQVKVEKESSGGHSPTESVVGGRTGQMESPTIAVSRYPEQKADLFGSGDAASEAAEDSIRWENGISAKEGVEEKAQVMGAAKQEEEVEEEEDQWLSREVSLRLVQAILAGYRSEEEIAPPQAESTPAVRQTGLDSAAEDMSLRGLLTPWQKISSAVQPVPMEPSLLRSPLMRATC